MNPWFYDLSQRLPSMKTRAELLEALADLEDHYDLFDEVDQEIAAQLISDLHARLDASSGDGG